MRVGATSGHTETTMCKKKGVGMRVSDNNRTVGDSIAKKNGGEMR
jgi:hypothetical protein